MKKSIPETIPTLARTRIFLVEDHMLVRQGIRMLLEQESDLEVIGEADAPAEALKGIAASGPDLVLTDITLREGSGIELIRQIKKISPSLPVIVVTMHNEAFHAEQAISAGASGYINKEKAMATVLTAIRSVMRGDTYLSDTTVEKLIRNHVKHPGPMGSDPVARLSTRERQVLQMIGEWKGTRQIAEELEVGIKTIEYYREQIKAKLGLRTGTELIQFATGRVPAKGANR